MHHRFTAPFGIAAIYAHPIEHMLSNVIPVSLGPLVMGSHPVTGMLWALLALLNTMTVHSGYHIPLLTTLSFNLIPPPYFHDWHHEHFNENFGALQVLDWALGTDTKYREAWRQGTVHVPRVKELEKMARSE